MLKQTPSQSINKAFRQVPINKSDLVHFKDALAKLIEKTTDGNTEENQKNNFRDFLVTTFYGSYEVNEKRPVDLAIHNGNNTDTSIGVIIEAKSTTNIAEMITENDLNRKAMQELVYYYLLERVEKGNNEVKHLMATNMQEFFIFDAQDFEHYFYQNKQLLKQFQLFRQGGTTDSSTKHFYEEIVPQYINQVADKIEFTYFDTRQYKKYIDKNEIEKLAPIYRIFSDTHLLKLPFQNDSNSLDKGFYTELLHLMGLEEVKEQNKAVIKRKNIDVRNEASMIENIIEQIDDRIYKLGSLGQYGSDRETQLFNIALEICITWINRILFLKLLESQLLKYHHNNVAYKFLVKNKIADFDELNDLFFKVLAKNYDERKPSLAEKFPNVPYLNSSLFELTNLEDRLIEINALSQTLQLPIPSFSVLKRAGSPYLKVQSLPLLDYLFAFLDAYNFSSEGEGEIQEETKTLINASVLGLIFEKINGHKDGAVFTPGYITMYMSREAINRAVIQKFNDEYKWDCNSIDQLYNKIDRMGDDRRANEIINDLKICDPAVGSGHFLVSALNEIIRLKYDLGILLDEDGRRLSKREYDVNIENDELMVTDSQTELPFIYNPQNIESQRIQKMLFREKQLIIENCLFGVDLNPNSVNICRLRLWIELLKNAYYTEESQMRYLETLPNIDINIKCGNSLLQRFSLDTDLGRILHDAHIDIMQYKEAVYQYKSISDKREKYEITDIINSIKTSINTQISKRDPKLISLNKKLSELNDLQGKDLFGYSGKEQKAREKRIKTLKAEIDRLEIHFRNIRENRLYKGAFEWRFEFPELLNDDGSFIGFDCIIGNPPYIQLQANGGELGELFANSSYETYERTGDVYCLFYEQGYRLLKENGILCYITSNKWMRAGYGESIRKFFSHNTDPQLLIDFAGEKVFDSATVEVNILLFKKANNQHQTICSIANRGIKNSCHNLSDFVQQQNTICDFNSSDSWVILSPIEQSIKRKIESVGTPLRDWDVQINYGIKTGFNDAFIISTEKRNEILANCKDEDERIRTAELIRPILRGRDIKRYGYDWANLYLIATFPSCHYDIDRYPAVKQYLLEFGIEKLEQTGKTHLINGEKVKARKKTNNKWFETQDSISYWEDFSKQQIVWIELSDTPKFAFTENVTSVNTVFFMTGESLLHLLGLLNSKLITWYFRHCIGTTSGVGTNRWLKYTIEQIPMAPYNPELEKMTKAISNQYNEDINHKIDDFVCGLYNLDNTETNYILFQDEEIAL